VLGSGGRELTDAISHDLDVPPETAEALKRALANPQYDETVERARAALDRPLSVLIDEVRSSIDYYRNQPGAARLTRVLVTGGSAQLPGLPERLGALVGTSVEPAYMDDLIRIGNIGFAPDELPRLEPYLPAAVGLALGGTGNGTVIDLMPRRGRRTTGVSGITGRLNKKVVAAVAAGVVLLGGATDMAHSNASSAQSKKAAAETEVQKLRNNIQHIMQAASPSGASGNLQLQAATALGGDVGWTGVIADLGKSMPAGVWMTAYQSTHTVTKAPAAPAPAAGAATTAAGGTTGGSAATPAASGSSTGAAGGVGTAPGAGASSCKAYQSPLTGAVTINGIATSAPALAAFIDNAAKAGDPKNPDLLSVWLVNAQKAKFGNVDVITFSVSATVAEGARSDRLETYFKGAVCSK
jgi:hypothetical protein